MARSIREIARQPSATVVHLGILLLCGIWGGTWLVIRAGLADLPPFTALAARFLLAGAVMALVAPRLARVEGGAKPSLGLSLVHGILSLALPYAIVYWVEVRLPSGLVSVLWSVFPLLTAVGAHFILPAERLVGRQWLGLIGGFVGVALMFATDIPALGGAAVPAALVLLVSPLVSAVALNWIKRVGGGTSSALMNQRGMLVAAALALVLALVTERGAQVRWSATAILSVVYLAVPGTVLTFGLYFWLLRHAAATKLSLVAYVIPIVALFLGSTLGGEAFRGWTVVGMVAILVGVGFVLRPPRGRAAGGGAAPAALDRAD